MSTRQEPHNPDVTADVIRVVELVLGAGVLVALLVAGVVLLVNGIAAGAAMLFIACVAIVGSVFL
jgi:hypothetical protein